jgi:tetratricopeptide (TPR) repeat protein
MVVKDTAYVNPYIAGNPVYGDVGFFGRSDVLRYVGQTLTAPGQNAVVLFGPRRIGKTSILLQLQHSLSPERYTVIYQDLQDKARHPMGDLLDDFADEIAYTLAMDGPELTYDDQGRVFQQEFLPQVYDALPGEAHRLVLLFDEFDVLDTVQREQLPGNAAAHRLFPTLRRWMRQEPNLAFVFALGRNLSDLDSDFLSTFKGGQTVQVSVLSKEETIALITAPTSLRFTDGAIDRIYALTNGHPYFTQLFCSLCFDRGYARPRDDTSDVPTITARDVGLLRSTVFSRGENVFAWIWDGLPPAERIVASALAELLTDEKIVASENEIGNLLRLGGVRVITRDLQVSPKILVGWQLLQEVDGGYRYMVPVLQQWIQNTKPLDITRDEIDRLNPRADRYYQLAKEEFQAGEFVATEENLQRVLRLNPDHLQARILLGDVKLEQGQLDEAIEQYRIVSHQDNKQVQDKLLHVLRQKSKQAMVSGRAQEAAEIDDQINEISQVWLSFKLNVTRLAGRELAVRAMATPTGEARANGQLPYDTVALTAVMKLLDTGEFAPQRFTSEQQELLRSLSLLHQDPVAVTSGLLPRLGQELYQALLPGAVGSMFKNAHSLARQQHDTVGLELHFDQEAVDLACYPWELLHDDHQHLLKVGAIELTRYVSTPEATTSLPVSPPWRLLYVASRPVDLEMRPDIDVATSIAPALRAVAEDSQLKFEVLMKPTFEALLELVDSADYHVLHFDGYCLFARRCPNCDGLNNPHLSSCSTCETSLADVPPAGYLAFEDFDGQVDYVGTDALETLVYGSGLRLILLSPPRSSPASGDYLFAGLGPALIRAGVPAVGVMQLPVSESTALAFAKGFYAALGQGETIPRAFARGRRRLFREGTWYVPTLYLRSSDGEGRLFIAA